MLEIDYLEKLLKKYTQLIKLKKEIISSFKLMINCYENGGKILTCGNAGSAADADHIVGELMKGFRLKRELSSEQFNQIKKIFPNEAHEIAGNLQQAIPSISLVNGIALPTAYANDKNSEYIFAQQVFGLGNKNDLLIAISTSGNSKNVVLASKIAKVKGMSVISLTGQNNNLLEENSDITIKAPSDDTAEIQEYHLPIYHCLCSMVEQELFN